MCGTINKTYRTRNKDNMCKTRNPRSTKIGFTRFALKHLSPVNVQKRSEYLLIVSGLGVHFLLLISFFFFIVGTAVPQMKQRAAGLSPWRSCINSRVNNVGFMEGEVTKGYNFLRVSKLFSVNIHSTNAANLFIHRHPGMQSGPDKRPTVSFVSRLN